MGIMSSDLDWAKKQYQIPRTNASIPKAFFALLQNNHELEPERTVAGMFSKAKDVYPVRAGIEQTQLLLKAGFDAIVDDARNHKTAVISEREPQQICFLTPFAFKVIEVFNLLPDNAKPNYLAEFDPGENEAKKLAAIVFSLIGDQIVTGTVRSGGESMFWWGEYVLE